MSNSNYRPITNQTPDPEEGNDLLGLILVGLVSTAIAGPLALCLFRLLLDAITLKIPR